MNRVFASLVAVFVVASVAIAAGVKSGLATGDSPSAFIVKDITGPSKGESLCYRCQYGARPVACVFTREITGEVKGLIEKLNAKVAENQEKNMSAFVVLLTDDAAAGAKQLAKLAEEIKVNMVPLTVYDKTAGPAEYKLSKEAGVTVMLWNKSRVEATHAFAPGKLTDEDVKKIVDDTSKILN